MNEDVEDELKHIIAKLNEIHHHIVSGEELSFEKVILLLQMIHAIEEKMKKYPLKVEDEEAKRKIPLFWVSFLALNLGCFFATLYYPIVIFIWAFLLFILRGIDEQMGIKTSKCMDLLAFYEEAEFIYYRMETYQRILEQKLENFSQSILAEGNYNNQDIRLANQNICQFISENNSEEIPEELKPVVQQVLEKDLDVRAKDYELSDLLEIAHEGVDFEGQKRQLILQGRNEFGKIYRR